MVELTLICLLTSFTIILNINCLFYTSYVVIQTKHVDNACVCEMCYNV